MEDGGKKLADCLVDVTLREGAQQKSELWNVAIEEKLKILKAQIAIGIRELELTAFAPGEWYSDSDALSEAVKPFAEEASIIGLYFNVRGAERLLEYPHLKPLGIYHTAATETYRQKNYNQPDLNNAYERLQKLSEWLQKKSLDLDVIVLSTAWGERAGKISEEETLSLIAELVSKSTEYGTPARQITLADTEGVSDPGTLTSLVSAVKRQHEGVKVVAHLHPDPDRAEGIVNAGIDAGVDGWEGSWMGLGGSPFADRPGGNLAIETLVSVWESRGLATGFNQKNIDKLLGHLQSHLTG